MTQIPLSLISTDLVSIQPLSLPDGRLFYFETPETEECRIARYKKEDHIAYAKEVDEFIEHGFTYFIFVSPGVFFREQDINFVRHSAITGITGIEYSADYTARFTTRTIPDYGGYLGFDYWDKKRIAVLENEDFQNYDHELMVYLN